MLGTHTHTDESKGTRTLLLQKWREQAKHNGRGEEERWCWRAECEGRGSDVRVAKVQMYGGMQMATTASSSSAAGESRNQGKECSG